MRYIVYGAGAIGGVIGGRLANDGHDVVLIARGPHLDALRTGGLRLLTPDEELNPSVTVAGSAAEAKPEPDDIVLLATKSQGTESALADLELVAPGATVICAQNGVDNERATARRGFNAYAMYVVLPATHLDPGVVVQHAAPIPGILDVGRYPRGADAISEQISSDLRAVGFTSRSDPTVMRWKYTKLGDNLGNALEALCGRGGRRSDLYRRARGEAEACYQAAGIDYVRRDEDHERRAMMSPMQSAGGVDHQGGSSWQSLARSTGNVEADWLNGEIVLLGRLHGIPTPVNEVLRRLVNRMAHDRVPAGSVPIDQVEAEVARLASGEQL
jgi:2-dehydropantoate 2-reductase